MESQLLRKKKVKEKPPKCHKIRNHPKKEAVKYTAQKQTGKNCPISMKSSPRTHGHTRKIQKQFTAETPCVLCYQQSVYNIRNNQRGTKVLEKTKEPAEPQTFLKKMCVVSI